MDESQEVVHHPTRKSLPATLKLLFLFDSPRQDLDSHSIRLRLRLFSLGSRGLLSPAHLHSLLSYWDCARARAGVLPPSGAVQHADSVAMLDSSTVL